MPATIGATLLTHGRTTISKLADALAATPNETTAAVSTLDPYLAVVGMSVARHHDELWLVPRTKTAAAASSDRPLSVAEARLLRRIHRGEDVRRALNNIDRQFTLPALQRRGLVEDGGSGPALTNAVAASLPRSETT